MELIFLPEEVIECIVEFLDVKDLIACSAVSVGWREKFNNDLFWKKFCTREINDYLGNIKSEVEPCFSLTDHKEEELQSLCKWRTLYMKEIHIINNWKSGQFLSSEIRPCNGVLSSDVKCDCKGNHWLFLRTVSEIEVWNINSRPQLCSKINTFLNCPNLNVLMAQNRVIITHWNVATVYDFKSNIGPIESLFRFLLEDHESLPLKFSSSFDKSEIENLNEVDDFRFYTFGSYLVGHKRIPNPPLDLSMHIWDTRTGEKLKTESMMSSLNDVKEVAFTNIFKTDDYKGLLRLLIVSHSQDSYSQLYGYDFKKLIFTSTNILIEGFVAWCGCAHDIIVTFTSHPGTIKFYNYWSGKLLSMKDIGIYTNSEQMLLIDSYLLYCMFNCMNVMDIHTQETVYCLEFSFHSYVRRLTVIEPRFVVVWLLERGGSPGCPSYYQEVWDMKDLSNKLLQFSSELGYEMITNSNSLMKQIISYNEMIYLYTFW